MKYILQTNIGRNSGAESLIRASVTMGRNSTFFGLQFYIKKYLQPVITKEDLGDADSFLGKTECGEDWEYNRKDWEYIVDELGGVLPIKISAEYEGQTITKGGVVMTIENTDPKCSWLVLNIIHLLGGLSEFLSTAYTSKGIIDILGDGINETSEVSPMYSTEQYINFKCDGIVGAAHLLSGRVSSSGSAPNVLREYYDGDGLYCDAPVCEGIESDHKYSDKEFEHYLNTLQKHPDGVVTVMANTFNGERFIENYTKEMRPVILERWMMGNEKLNRTILRFDGTLFDGDASSGLVLWGYKELAEIFGFTVNSKGMKVLHPAVGIMYCDDISIEDVESIKTDLVNEGWSTENLVLGRIRGGGSGVEGGGLIVDFNNQEPDEKLKGLPEIFKDGKLLVNHTLKEIRNRISA